MNFFEKFIYLSLPNIYMILGSLIVIIVPLLICVAIFTLTERKVMATIQRRRGPNVVGF